MLLFKNKMLTPLLDALKLYNFSEVYQIDV